MRLRIGIAFLLLAALLPATSGASEAPVADLGGLVVGQGRGIARTAAEALQLDDRLRPAARGTRIALISSGVDAAVFPESLRPQIAGHLGDAVGYGTYAATVLLQLDPDVKITSLRAYRGTKFEPGLQQSALLWAIKNATNIDAVLYAVPPSEFLDPVSAAMAGRRWHAMSRGVAHPSAMTPRQREEAARLNDLAARWSQARASVSKIVASGVPFVAPAGDFGPEIQTTFGIANMPEVVTVGAASGDRVSATSSSGPSIDGRVKPDLVAPAGIVGVMPQGSALAGVLARDGLLDRSLRPAWSAGEPLTDARARVDSTSTSAAIVAAAMAGLRAQGIRDVATMRGALTAVSVPLAGPAVWRQGAGSLRTVPDATFARSRTLVLSPASFGAEPASGVWSVALPVAGGRTDGAATRITEFAGVGPDGTTTYRGVKQGTSAQPVATVGNDGVTLTLPLGNDRYEGGLYCGYTAVSLPGTSGAVQPSVRAEGIPAGVEHVPTCFVEGSRLRAFGFYIHDIPAEDLTFSLLPDIPVAGSLLKHALHILPMDPLSTKLYTRVTGKDGFADFPNVPPGFYTIRQFSDYGSPVSTTLVDEKTRSLIPVKAELGEESAYQDVHALVLSPVCTRQVRDAASSANADPCSERFLKDRFGEKNVEFDKVTATYVVNVAGRQLRIAFDFMKKMPGPAVTSRYIDLLSYGDFGFSASALDLKAAAPTLKRLGVDKPQVWKFAPGASGAIEAAYNPAAALLVPQSQRLGIAQYPFGLATPNYKMHMSLNFSYELVNSVIAVIVQVGDELATGLVTPVGGVQAPAVGPFTPLTLDGLAISGHSQGLANFDFKMLPRGASKGTITFVFAPPPGLAVPVSSAHVGDMSFEMDTWTDVEWPPVTFDGPAEYRSTNPAKPGVIAGHSFRVRPNYSTRQMATPACRDVRSGGGATAKVCEDWTVLVHSPKDDAATFEVWDVSRNASMLQQSQVAGTRLFDPKRGVHDFSWRLAVSNKDLVAVDVNVPHEFRTNGRFWEQLALPEDVLASSNVIEFRIVDNRAGGRSPLFGHVREPGGSPVDVAPYVPFVPTSSFVELKL